MVSGANGEDTANARGLAAAVSRESIVNVIIRRQKTAAITVSASASNTAVAAPESARQAVQILGMY